MSTSSVPVMSARSTRCSAVSAVESTVWCGPPAVSQDSVEVWRSGAGRHTARATGRFGSGALGATTRRTRPTKLFLVGAALAFSLAELLAGLMPSFGLTAVALIPAGFTMITMAQSANATVQLGVDSTMRGRVMGLYVLCFIGGTPIGAPIVGRVAELFGPRWGMLGGGLICLVATLLVAGYVGRRGQVGSAQVVERLRSPHPFSR